MRTKKLEEKYIIELSKSELWKLINYLDATRDEEDEDNNEYGDNLINTLMALGD